MNETTASSYQELIQTIEAFEVDPFTTFYFTGLGLEIELPETDAYHRVKVGSLVDSSAEIEANDPSFHSYCARFPADVMDALRSGRITLDGSILYNVRTSAMLLNRGSDADRNHHVIIYQDGDPMVNRFTFGFQEAQILSDLGDVNIVLSHWNSLTSENLPSRKPLTLDRLRENRTPSRARTVLYNLGGLYAICREFDPYAAIQTVARGSCTDEFIEALILLGFEMKLTVCKSETLDRLRQACIAEEPSSTDSQH